MPATLGLPTRHANRLLWSATIVVALAACADNEPTAPTSERTKGTPELSLAQTAISARAKQLRPIKDRLSGSAYRLFFGHQVRLSNFGLRLRLGVGRGAAPRDLQDVLVNDRGGPGLVQSETTIADHGGTLVVGWNDADGFYPGHFEEGATGWGISPDGGGTFIDGGGLPRIATPGFFHGGDPGLAVGNNGTFFFSDLCFDFGTEPVLSGVCVTAGRRQGHTINWHSPVYAASSLPDFLDKSFIATDRQGQDVYVSYTRFQIVDTVVVGVPIEVVASYDGGQSFGPPVVAGPFLGLFQSGSEPAVGPDGELYVVWVRYPSSTEGEVVVAKSTDGGHSFQAPVRAATFVPVNTEVPGYNRVFINDSPRIDVARSGPYKGEIYVSFHSAAASLADAYLVHSPDGFSWSEPVRVNDDLTDYQFWPAVAVEPSGNVDVIWYDRRLDPGTAITNTFWSQSTDNGETFRPNVRVSDVGSDWAAAAADAIPNFGDYIDVAAGGNRAYGAWGDGRLGDPDVFFSELRGVGKSPSFAVAR